MPDSGKPSPTKSQQKHASTRVPSSSSARLKEADPSWRAKLGLRALAAVLALASASCFCTALAVWPQPASSRMFLRRRGIDLTTDSLPLFPDKPQDLADWNDNMQLFWSILFAILFAAYLFARKRPIHPGYVIASDLAVWVTIGGLGFWVVIGSGMWDYVGPGSAHVCVKSATSDSDCEPGRRTKGLCELAGLSLLAATLVAHFALFVWLCREVDVRRKGEKKRELEALYPRFHGKDEEGEMATFDGADMRGVPPAKTKRGERMAAEELSW